MQAFAQKLGKVGEAAYHEIIRAPLRLFLFFEMPMDDAADHVAVLFTTLPQQNFKLHVAVIVDNRCVGVQVVPEEAVGEEIARDVVLGGVRPRVIHGL